MSWDSILSPDYFKIRSDIIAMIENNWTDEEILECFPGVMKGSITAFRAHLTRGTYDGLSKRKSKASIRSIHKN